MQQKWDLPGASMLVLKFFRFSRALHTNLFLQWTSDPRIFDSKTRMEPSMTWLNKSSPLWVLPLAGSDWKVSKRRITCLHGPVALMENAACYAQTFCAKFSRFVWIWRVSSPHAWLNLGVTISYKCFFDNMSVCSSWSSGGSGFAATRSRDPTGNCTESWSHWFVIRGNPCTGFMTGKPVAANWRNHEKPLDKSWQFPQEIGVPVQLPYTFDR